MLEALSLYLAFGALAGILSGMFGIGGGVVIVPFLAWELGRLEFPPQAIMVIAVATSLATIVFTSISAVMAHHRRGAVLWRTVASLSPGILAGAVIGSVIADRLPVLVFKLIFACFLFFVAFRMLISRHHSESHASKTGAWIDGLAGLVIGSVSAILGIGGGTLTVPFLVKRQHAMTNAVAISSACGFPIALAGAASYIVLGINRPDLPEYCLGYIYLPAFAGIVFTSFLFAPMGATLAHRLPVRR
jgi:uncharacterized membrane protein YfcA